MATSTPRAAAIDGPAITLSGLCLIHYLFLPILSASLPSIAGLGLGSEWLHKAFVVAALPFALIAISSSSASVWVRGLIAAGFTLLALGAFYEPLHDHEVLLTVLGGVTLAGGHALRWISGYSPSQS